MSEGSTAEMNQGIEQLELRKTNAYLVYERRDTGEDRIRGIFPDTKEGLQSAIVFGSDEFDSFSAAVSERDNGYLTKVHGLVIPERHSP